ncbi:hypothetical protein XV78_13740 [Vibrio cholerae]|nr:hypothetical protein XV74_15625 [Vibrio cholerae]KQA45564.1 hypothetical protein XV75_09955 [Vibrio cholerae]KQA52398.1 hypothetical protein XV79_17970 [Vibrio cholerae]KQA52785.1 hypothetical protein XV78_13740 [Vibrio cholerae]KQA62244.1 hypothetical protein XV81_14620 [Vibrio cholerae]
MLSFQKTARIVPQSFSNTPMIPRFSHCYLSTETAIAVLEIKRCFVFRAIGR